MTTHDIAELQKWLNEDPNRSLDKAALARVLHEVERLRAQVAEWERLREPDTLHANLLRGVPAQLTAEHLQHLQGAPAQQAEQAAAHDNATLERGIQLGMYRERQRAEALAQQAQIDHAVITTGEAWVMPDGRVLNALDVRAQPPAQGLTQEEADEVMAAEAVGALADLELLPDDLSAIRAMVAKGYAHARKVRAAQAPAATKEQL